MYTAARFVMTSAGLSSLSLALLILLGGCRPTGVSEKEDTGAVSDADGDGYTVADGDCDDSDPTIYPGADEYCNGVDNDCNGVVDDDYAVDALTWYLDADGDGFGDSESAVTACLAPQGYVADRGDCDDDDPLVNPAAMEVPANGKDDDCDGHEAVVVQVEAGRYHGLVLDDLGRVWSWGRNDDGQLGHGVRYTDHPTPAAVNDIIGAVQVAAGSRHSIALLDDGTVMAWGANDYGQLGNGTTTSTMEPTPVNELGDVVQVAAGSGHSLALLDDGTVMAWGDNDFGQLGDGTAARATTPVGVHLVGTDVRAVDAGYYHSLALLGDGTARTWGLNGHGQLGDGTRVQSYLPVTVLDVSSAAMLAGGGSHSLALLDDGTVMVWGANDYGQLGDGTGSMSLRPIAVGSIPDAARLFCGNKYSLALLDDGTVMAWGANDYGQLGDGTTTDRSTPVEVTGLGDVVSVAPGWTHTLALLVDGSLVAWGRNDQGQLGDGTTTSVSSPQPVVFP